MLNEPSGANEAVVLTPSVSAAAPVDTLHAKLRAAVEEVFFIETENENLVSPITASYTGTLLIDSITAYDKLDIAFKALDHIPIFTAEKDRHVIRAMKGRFDPKPRPVWVNAVLFVLTIFSLLFTGSRSEGSLNLLDGLPYAIGLILILGAHELGHYFAARRHNVAVTLPYFIPLPGLSLFGTMGAFIQLREPMRNRRVLFDVGAAGPLIGLLVAIPVLLIGLKTSPMNPSPFIDVFMLKQPFAAYGQEGNSLLYMGAKLLVFGRIIPDGINDVTINQLAFAGWVGLLVTSLNLVPLGQLDGGHVIYSLIGEKARVLYLPLLFGLGILAVLFGEWLFWVILLLFFGRIYATPLDMITTLDQRRRVLAIATLVIFVLVFMPLPFQFFYINVPQGLLP
jgi:Zn-dependent protease